MIDTGIKIEIASAAGSTAPVVAWNVLKDCVAMPALIQPSSKIATDFIGDQFTGEMLGKRAITGLDFTFAYDGGGEGKQFRILSDIDDNDENRWLRITYPDGTKFELLVACEVTLVPPTPSGEIDYTLAVTPVRNTIGELILVVYPDEADPLEDQEFNVTFKYQDGVTEDTVEEIERGDKVTEPVDPTREGYTFKGWYTTSIGSGLPYNFNSSVYSDFTLYAVWEAVGD